MGKEIKIGLGIIGGLLCVFGGVLFMRLKKEQPLLAEAKAVVEKVEAKLKPKKDGKDKTDKAKGRKPALDSAVAKRPSRSHSEESADPGLDRYGRPLGDEPQDAAPNTSIDPPANQAEPPALDKSPYRNRPRDDRYARYPTEPEAGDESDEPVPADNEPEEATDDVALPADRFSPGGAGLALSPADDSGEMPANDGELPADDEAAPEAMTPADEQVADDSPPPSRYNDEQAIFPGRAMVDEALTDNREAPASEPQEPTATPQQSDEPDGYTVEPNDNFWRISQKLYGTGAYFKALEEYNRQRFGDQVVIHAGDVISAPPLDVLRAQVPSLVPNGRNLPAARRPARGRRSYTVAAGDTLFDIARQELGKASRWSEIYDLNRDQLGNDFNDLTPGMKLALPDNGQAEPVIGGSPPDRYRR